MDAFAEERGPDADAGAAFFDSDGEVVGHADGELGQGGVEALLLVSQATQMLEVGARGFGVFGPWGDGHEAAGDEVLKRGEGVEQGGEFLRGGAVFRLFGGAFG